MLEKINDKEYNNTLLLYIFSIFLSGTSALVSLPKTWSQLNFA